MDKNLILGIDVSYLHAADETLSQWLQEILGLEIIYDDGHWIEYEMKNQSRFAVDVVGSTPSAVEKQPVMISFLVENIHQAVSMLNKRGVQFYPSPENAVQDIGPALVATFKDPAGNWHQLSQQKNPEE